ncbi:hypothetical protein HBO14_11305 [Pseudomonas sp. WS 5406]|uniref:hypothetical protein n=1 Tax=Pseudomonas sp. WS 5406 TaxID=2717498 RepID=UPI001473D27A|nr:hypothetical protein [Pseudomonas sp. WS 5406]NMX27113.1 hypothetical protein [Pseudomonas sp. WS 5406]
MAVQPGPTDKRYAANGVSTIYTVPFLVIEAGDLDVYLNDVLMTSGYTHTGLDNPTSTLTFTTPPLGDLYLLLDVPFQRLTDYQENGDFLASTVNRDFDRIWQALKQLFGWANRSLRLGAFDIDGQGSYRAKGNGIIDLASSGENPSAATNLKDVRDYVSGILETGQGPINNSANVLYVRPSGTPGVVQDLATGEGYDYVGATLPTGVFSTVKGFFNWILDRITLSTSGSAGIVDAVAKGGKVVIKNGVHLMAAPAVCDYSAYPEVGFPGTSSKRYDISGETPGGTVLSNQHSDYAIKLIGSHPVTQNISGLDTIGNLTIIGPAITTPNTDGSGGAGIFVQTKAYTSIHRYSAFNLSLGLHLDGVLTSTVEDVTIVGCYEGILIDDVNNTSGPNATNLRRIKIGEATSNGARIEVGASLQIDNLTIEGCGSRGGTAVGLLLQTKPGSIAATTMLNSPYFELNAGPADVYISHVAAQDMILNVNGGLFHRTSPIKFVDTHFLVRSEPGAGRVTVNLKGVKFHGSFGYVPSSAFPYFDVGARCEVVWDAECQFSELVSMNYWLCLGREYTFTVSAAGAILSGPEGFSCTKISTGSYRFSRSAGKAEFSKFSGDYSVIAMPTTPASNIYLFDRQTTTFEVRLDNGSTLIDAPFSVTVKRINGYYA